MPLTVTMDDTLKAQFSDICAEIGMSASTAINVFAKKVVREKRIPFELSSQTDDERAYEREARFYERQFAQMAWDAYESEQAGQGYSWDDVLAAREARKAHA